MQGIEIPKDQIAAALRDYGGNVTFAAQELKVSRTSLFRRISADPELAAIVEDARESIVDLAESTLKRKVAEGDMQAVRIALLSSKAGRARGYGEKAEVDVKSGVTIVFEKEFDGL